MPNILTSVILDNNILNDGHILPLLWYITRPVQQDLPSNAMLRAASSPSLQSLFLCQKLPICFVSKKMCGFKVPVALPFITGIRAGMP